MSYKMRFDLGYTGTSDSSSYVVESDLEYGQVALANSYIQECLGIDMRELCSKNAYIPDEVYEKICKAIPNPGELGIERVPTSILHSKWVVDNCYMYLSLWLKLMEYSYYEKTKQKLTLTIVPEYEMLFPVLGLAKGLFEE